MGFWVGVKDAYENIREEKRQDELILEEKTMAMLPLVAQRMQAEKATAVERKRLAQFFQSRLSSDDLDKTTVDAYVNLATSDPSTAEAIMKGIFEVEKDNNIKLSGSEIVKFSNVIEQTKPEDMSLEDWTKQAASMSTFKTSGFDAESTIERLLAGDLDKQSLKEMQIELSLPTATSTGPSFVPSFDRSTVVGVSPSDQQAFRKMVVDQAKAVAVSAIENYEQQAAAATEAGTTLPEETQQAYNRIKRIFNSEDPDSALFQEYAHLIVPDMAKNSPEIARVFPQFFNNNQQTSPQVIRLERVGGDLREVQ